MLKTVFSTTLAFSLILGASAMAQTTEAEAEAPKTETDQAAASDDAGASELESQLAIGEDASEQPGQPYTKETNGAWELRCVRSEADEDPCQMYQLMEDSEGVPVSEISLFRLPGKGKAKAGATVIVPLETSLPSQLTITIDGGQAKRYPYAFCNPIGCYARIGLTDADIAAYKRGNEAVLTLVPAAAPDQKVRLKMSLDGFTASYDKVSVITQ